jgi:hypothetical protein
MAVVILDQYGKLYKIASSEENIIQICSQANNAYKNQKYTVSDADYLELRKNIKFVSGVENGSLVYEETIHPDSTKEAMDYFVESTIFDTKRTIVHMPEGALKTSYQNCVNTLESLDTSTFTYPIVGGLEKFLIENGVPDLVTNKQQS